MHEFSWLLENIDFKSCTSWSRRSFLFLQIPLGSNVIDIFSWKGNMYSRKFIYCQAVSTEKRWEMRITLSPPSLQGKHTSLTLFCNKLCIISSQLHPCLNRAHVLFHFCFKCVHPENQSPQWHLLRLSQMFGYALRSGKHAGLWSHKAYLSWVWMGSCMGAKQLIPVINQQNKTRQDEIRINLILYVNISMASLALTFTFQMALIWTSIYLYRYKPSGYFHLI